MVVVARFAYARHNDHLSWPPSAFLPDTRNCRMMKKRLLAIYIKK
jgi:hypothetical protein